MYFIYLLQHWINPYLDDQGISIFTYMHDLQKLTTDKTNIDGIQIVVLAHMLQRNITVVHMEGFWSIDANMATDIVIAYTGPPQKLFFPTQVGN